MQGNQYARAGGDGVGGAYEPFRTLPAAWYTDPELLGLEHERIFDRTWQFAGLLSELSAPGAYVTTTVGRVPVVVVRGAAGELRAFVNVCRHRGSEIVQQRAGRRQTLQCPYHGWTYRLDGSLLRAPRSDDTELERDALCLESLRVDAVGPFVFVSADPGVADLADGAAAWPELLGETGLAWNRLVFRERRSYDVAANWKLLVENFLECYHGPVSHHAFSDLIDLDSYEGALHTDLFWHFSSTVRESAVAADHHALAEQPPARRRLWNFVLWPNFMANVYPGAPNVSTNLLAPLAADRTLAVYDFYFEAGVSEDEQRANVDFVDQVQQEDIKLCESVQRGLRSGRLPRGRLLRSEAVIDRFDRQVAEAITGTSSDRADEAALVRL